MAARLISSLFDFTGNWSKPYREAGYEVEQVDIKHGADVLAYVPSRRPWGVLAAPPCTIWTNAAAWMWKGVAPAEFELQKSLVLKAAEICRSAESFWCLENPRGRIGQLLGPHCMEFQPYEYGDAWSKRTCLWGVFNPPRQRLVIPAGARACQRSRDYPLFGAKLRSHDVGLDTPMPKKFSKCPPEWMEARREARSATPPNFAKAFFEANP